MHALLICEQKDEGVVLTVILQQVGMSVRTVGPTDAVIEQLPEQPVDLVVVSLPEGAERALELVKQLRAFSTSPIIVIGDALSNDSCVELLDLGADLVIPRPYDIRLLNAQVRSTLRRTAGMPFFSLPILEQSGIKLEPANHTVIVEKTEPVRLTRLEFRLMFTLMTHAGQIIPTESLVEHVWGYAGDGNRELVRGLVQRLRAKVEPEPRNPRYIITETTIGYYFAKERVGNSIDE